MELCVDMITAIVLTVWISEQAPGPPRREKTGVVNTSSEGAMKDVPKLAGEQMMLRKEVVGNIFYCQFPCVSVGPPGKG